MTVLPLLLALSVAAPMSSSHPTSGPGAAVAAAEVVHTWDVRRADAWAAGDTAALRRLYARGAAAGREDVAMLRAWRARGLRVDGLQTQLLAVSVRRWSRGVLVVSVVDRVVGGTVEPAGSALPVDRPTAHTLALRWQAGWWRVAGVSDAGR